MLPYTIDSTLEARRAFRRTIDSSHPAFDAETQVRDRINKLLAVNVRIASLISQAIRQIIWDKCGMARSKKGLLEAIDSIQSYAKFWSMCGSWEPQTN